MSTYQVSALEPIILLTVAVSTVSVFYFAQLREKSLLVRIAAASPGIFFALIGLTAVLASPYTEYRPELSVILVRYALSPLLAIGLLAAAVNILWIRSWVHYLQIGNVPAGLILWAVSAMAVTHEWI